MECVFQLFPQCLVISICSVVTKNAYHRHKGVSVGWVNSFWLSKLLFWLSKMRFCENWSLWAKVGGHAGPPLPLRRPEEARSADDGRSSGNGGPACQPTFGHSALFSQNLILLSQNKAIYSAKTKLLSQRKPLYAYDMTFLGQPGSI